MSYLLEEIEVKKLIGLDEPEKLNKIKLFVSKIYEDAGYSNSPWKNIDHYDLWSTWFYIEENGQIFSAMRITEKKPYNFIPLEVALFKDEKLPPKRYAVIEENVADWNSVAFIQNVKGAKAAKVNFIAVAGYCVSKGYDIVYGMYNPKLSGIERIYLREGAVISDKYPGPMYFPGLYLKGEIPWFEVIEIGKESLQKIALKKQEHICWRFANLIEAGIGLFVFSLGCSVWIFASNKPVRNYFFLLTISLAAWLVCLGLRVYTPNEYRSAIVNWTLIPATFTPHFLHFLIFNLFNSHKIPKEMSWKSMTNIIILVYFLVSIVNCNVVHLTEPEKFAYAPTWIYHLLIGYCSFYILISLIQVLFFIFQKHGDDRVKAFLFFFGIIISLLVSLIFVYILPLHGYFFASNSAFRIPHSVF